MSCSFKSEEGRAVCETRRRSWSDHDRLGQGGFRRVDSLLLHRAEALRFTMPRVTNDQGWRCRLLRVSRIHGRSVRPFLLNDFRRLFRPRNCKRARRKPSDDAGYNQGGCGDQSSAPENIPHREARRRAFRQSFSDSGFNPGAQPRRRDERGSFVVNRAADRSQRLFGLARSGGAIGALGQMSDRAADHIIRCGAVKIGLQSLFIQTTSHDFPIFPYTLMNSRLARAIKLPTLDSLTPIAAAISL